MAWDVFLPWGGVLSADRRVDAIEVRCASFTQILALPDNHGTRGRGRVRGRLRLKNENDSWIDEEETSRNAVLVGSFLVPRNRCPIVLVLELELVLGSGFT